MTNSRPFTPPSLSLKQWRRNKINIVGARRGPKRRNSKAKGLSQGCQVFWRGGLPPLPTTKRFVGALGASLVGPG